MVGVGSGMAPFVGFLEERQRKQPSGRNVLYYGCMRRDWDFIFRNRMEALAREGVVDLHVAFRLFFIICINFFARVSHHPSKSHERPDAPVFAQHLMANQKDYIWDMISNQNALLFVCGHTRLGAGVDAFLRKLFLEKHGHDEIAATNFYNSFYEQGRYKVDCFA